MEQSRGKSLLGGGDDDAAAARRTLFAPDETVPAEPNVIVVPAAPAAATPAEPTPEPEASIRPDADLEPVVVKRRPNPWLLLLWAFGLVATIGGLAVDYQYVRSYTYGSGATDDAASAFALAELIAYQSPGVVTAGLVAIGLALAIHALQWSLARNRR